ncbi:MAG: squalene synthase HpnD [Calditrichaeota bacterium]|nr:MAG: squalene synthase HpnD [Calditrichota bacterium]
MSHSKTLDPSITPESKSNFLFSFFLLPREKREAIFTLYAFCRQTDDIADNNLPLEKRIMQLNRWEKELKKCFVNRVSNYFDSLVQVAEMFKIPYDYFLELIEGVRMDLTQLSYRSFEDLKLYCYRVASTVGLMCIEIFGYQDPLIKSYAENLGIALQLTNIIRDVGYDAHLGRVYIPGDELKRFGLNEEDILQKQYSRNFVALMKYQAQRAREYYKKAEECLPPSEKKNMLVSEVMKNIYLKLLSKVEEHEFQVFQRRISLNTPSKLWITLRTFSQIHLEEKLGKEPI